MVRIRNYQVSDAKALWEIFFHTVRNINVRDYTQEQVEAWAPSGFDFSLWQKRMDGLQPFVAELDGQVVGYTDLQPSGLVDHFFCHHEYQGQGVGRALMEHVFAVGRVRGVSRYFSEVSITARPFYERMGFKVVNEQQVEMRGVTLTNYEMERVVE
ncbi:GNAT family N-acetyltransferase [Vibrio sp. 10N.261.46.E12]|uniref:GNAT family N-acetyltransferase n=1 Tax=unclassified Vibrio TaxID=2614977 RepID=UPI0009771A06|nr:MULTISPECIES: GNAT family N-acetyltransferase [unclassified Vibrio]OMO37667.1 GNAT family N-acetyltransferase [Vibrio sp. 10N.261.45.E1]PMJ19660.1 GNAT family N-acetyltransferase [Vibrio sp. 10N.286.45.B6]PML93147.1 GNAT family N-acetyltransferase [Vibrio sp. 10N.261.49.E11]PMM66588.1 GNAT family N-acetyltransferase [Vibrio sp. 10N.261.46.F12]PMM86322.1 GNAT family N-acetyltransferase [Vibrio sp. 10N.261.46.E8]